MKYLLFFCLLLSGWASYGQETEQDKIRLLEQRRDYERSRQVRARMDSGIYYLDKGDYELADEKFRYALANMKSIPSDLTFYFGKNSYYFGHYKQSVDWLTKYIQLKGTAGQFSTEAADLLKKAETALIAEHNTANEAATQIFSQDYTIDCGPAGKVSCPVCSGTTVIVRKDYFGETYKTCQYCDTHGKLTCDEYNKLLKGQLKPRESR